MRGGKSKVNTYHENPTKQGDVPRQTRYGMILSTLVTAALLLTSPVLAVAGPWLTCDPVSETITSVEVERVDSSGNPYLIGAAASCVSGECKIWLDLTFWPDGDYTVTARWANAYGWSDWSLPLSVTLPIPPDPNAPAPPQNLYIKE